MRNDCFTLSWLAARLGGDPAQIEARRRAGELLAIPSEGELDYLFPAWQFGADGNPLPVLGRLLATAGNAGLSPAELDAFLNRRVGVGGPKMWELIRDGREDYVLASLRAAPESPSVH
jgi:hypothetical protein